jgi:acyl-[acyl-carrier-protein]-phospholipid O-acyltransferase/long-chain-fatty-acid--[acyl-carrier-protein] ligase
VLPVFHSFGLTAGLVLPLVSGVPVYLYPSPLHYRMVPELVYGCNATILFGTDTFLTGYARAAHPYDLRSLRYIVAGAEPVKDTTRRTYAEKFGLRILEGYGVTEDRAGAGAEHADVQPLRNGRPDHARHGSQARADAGRRGGRPAACQRPEHHAGLSQVRESRRARAAARGLARHRRHRRDRQGRLRHHQGRAKRFAKIAGEMVSLAAVEALAAECWPGVLSGVASLPDARKGERLVLVTQQKDATRAAFQTFAKGKGAADLMIPAEVMVVSAVPVLGSGKLDFAGISRLVKERAQAPVAAVVA